MCKDCRRNCENEDEIPEVGFEFWDWQKDQFCKDCWNFGQVYRQSIRHHLKQAEVELQLWKNYCEEEHKIQS